MVSTSLDEGRHDERPHWNRTSYRLRVGTRISTDVLPPQAFAYEFKHNKAFERLRSIS